MEATGDAPGRHWELGADDTAVTFEIATARMVSMTFDGLDVLVADDGNGPWSFGAFVMAPWTSLLPGGRLAFGDDQYRLDLDDGADAVLGLTWKLPWRRVGDRLTCDLTQAAAIGWPFGGTAWLRPSVAGHAVHVGIGFRAGDRPLPAAVGWHPWFRRHLTTADGTAAGEPARLEPGHLVWRQGRDRAGRPDGTWSSTTIEPGALNDCLQLAGPARLVWPGAGELAVQHPSPWTTVFDANPRGVCVEPTSSPAELMLHVLQPHEELVLPIDLTWTPARPPR